MSLRFCHVTTFYPPHNFGGDGIGIERLVRALARRGHPQTVVVDTDAYRLLAKREPELPASEPGIEIVRLSSSQPTLSMLLTQQLGRPVFQRRALRELLESQRFDVVNFHNVSLVGGPTVWSYGSAVKLQMAHEHWLVCPSHVLWRHNRELCDARECLRCQLNFKRPPQLWRSSGLLERHGLAIDAFIAMSAFSRAKHREFGFPFEMEVLPYFLPDPPSTAAPARTRDAAQRPYFLFVGRIERIKGLDDVIPLMRELPQAELRIAGAGDDLERLKELARGLENVRFLGRLSNEDLSREYAGCAALVVPSICFETFGIILIEAFRQGAPVIARRLGPFPEIVESARAGELFSTREELLAALRRVLADPERAESLGRNGHAAFLERYTESAVVPRYLELVERAAARKGRALRA